MRFSVLMITICAASAVAPVWAQAGTCAGMTPGQLTSLNGYVPFPASNLWNTDVSTANVDPNSANIINYIGSTKPLHADFGSGTYNGQSIGIPYQVVTASQAKVNVKLGTYASESDPGPKPIPSNALIEGYPKPGNGDRHVLVLEKDGCWLYELGNAYLKNGAWSASGASVFDMTINEQRPWTWTSTDAAGLSVFAGLARYDEVASGAIHHALRYTVSSTRQAFTPPASHWASSVTDPNAPPMGTRLRLKQSINIATFPPQSQVILKALQQYGMILADNGSSIYISGAPNAGWDNNDLSSLKQITAADFEVVNMGTVYTPGNVPTGSAPVIGSFTANPTTVPKGQPVTLSWSTTNAEYNIIDPVVGPVRGTSITFIPSATTTLKLYSTNQYGRSTKSVTVTVQ